MEAAARRAIDDHVGRPYPGRVTLVRSDEYQRRGAFIRWSEVAEGGVEACDVPAGHLALMREPAVGLVAARIAERIDSLTAV